MSKTKNVLVVGMPRSGTSLTASIFTNKGYFVAENKDEELRDSDEYNPSGYWEAEPLIRSNAEILNAAGFKHDNTWLFDAITAEQADAIANLTPTDKHKALVEKFNNNSPWIWKDPRLCYTLSYWWPLLDPQTTRVLFLKRDPNEIYQSFIRLEWRKTGAEAKQDVMQRITDHLAAAERALKQQNIPYIEINYSDYKNQPEKTVKGLNTMFGLDLSVDDLGYKHKYNNQSLQGKLFRWLKSLGNLLPNGLRQFIKKLIPQFIWKLIIPHRFSK